MPASTSDLESGEPEHNGRSARSFAVPSDSLRLIADIYIPLSVGSALLILTDIYVLGRRQHMAIMEAVWPLTMLYWGPIGLLAYFWFGRGGARRRRSDTPMWQATFKGAAHCGAGCALGDFIGDWIAFAAAFTFLGSEFGGKLLLAFALAYLFGIVFQYFSVAPMQGLGLRDGLIAAIKVDTLSLLAYEIGMFAWMGFRSWLYPNLQPADLSYWLMMQVAMVLGFATTYPVNWWLIARGTKEKM
ncbi:MAG TPA: DUF4396 domain-containing protein [Stellaceae bacterium]|jgi:hypothetical protein|nr:DUF4396 domain-containing protein [Stellaceae bacterium]